MPGSNCNPTLVYSTYIHVCCTDILDGLFGHNKLLSETQQRTGPEDRTQLQRTGPEDRTQLPLTAKDKTQLPLFPAKAPLDSRSGQLFGNTNARLLSGQPIKIEDFDQPMSHWGHDSGQLISIAEPSQPISYRGNGLLRPPSSNGRWGEAESATAQRIGKYNNRGLEQLKVRSDSSERFDVPDRQSVAEISEGRPHGAGETGRAKTRLQGRIAQRERSIEARKGRHSSGELLILTKYFYTLRCYIGNIF